ncbi:MAG: glutamate synthase, partial [Chloroflexota bacterium]
RDFNQLPAEKQRVYQMLQTTHMHASPDGPWFFLIAQSERDKEANPVYRLTGITDTSMLRPQVFAWQEHKEPDGSKVSIGFAASEKQAIDAALDNLASEDKRFWSRADRYWNARGGSHTDGGAFMFSVKRNGSDKAVLDLTDKFGNPVAVPTQAAAYLPNGSSPKPKPFSLPDLPAKELFAWALERMPEWQYEDAISFAESIVSTYQSANLQTAVDTLTLLIDRKYATGNMRRSSLLSIFSHYLVTLFQSISATSSDKYTLLSHGNAIPDSAQDDQTVVIDADGFAQEGPDSIADILQKLYANEFRKYIIFNLKGQRFIANGLGPDTAGVEIELYGSPGDYLASGMDGMQINVHANGQDQLAQIMKSGKLVVHGDVGQTFMYGAKGGEAYILGNAAGRPLINAVGGPRVVINGTCLDYLAESCMAGDPQNGGGFVIVNGIKFGEDATILDLETPYPGGNLYSLASGGAIYMRDPHNQLSDDQLNGGEFVAFTDKDWEVIKPYLQENERLFNIPIERLLSVDNVQKKPAEVFRKIQPRAMRALQAEEAWVTSHK